MSEKLEKTDVKTNDGEKIEKKDKPVEKKIIIEHVFKTPEKEETKDEPTEKVETSKEKTLPEKVVKKPETQPEKTDNEEPKDDKKIKDLEEKLQNREAQLATIALKAFEDNKKDLLELVKDEKKKKSIEKFIGDDPEKLEQVRLWTTVLTKGLEEGGVTVEGKESKEENETKTNDKEPTKKDETPEKTDDVKDDNPDDVETPPPKGVVGLPTATGTKASQERIIDDLFKILDNPDQDPKTMMAKEEANKRINVFYRSLLEGRRKGIKEGREKYGFSMTMCPKCSKMIMGRRDEEITKCPYCKAVFTRRK